MKYQDIDANVGSVFVSIFCRLCSGNKVSKKFNADFVYINMNLITSRIDIFSNFDNFFK